MHAVHTQSHSGTVPSTTRVRSVRYVLALLVESRDRRFAAYFRTVGLVVPVARASPKLLHLGDVDAVRVEDAPDALEDGDPVGPHGQTPCASSSSAAAM